MAVAATWLVGFGGAAARMAMERQRPLLAWAFFGAILGPVALVLLRLAPPGRCANCASPTLGWLILCPWCGEDVRGMTEPEPGADPGRVHHGPLTVIDGTGHAAAMGGAGHRTTPPRRPEADRTADPGSERNATGRDRVARSAAPDLAAVPALGIPSDVIDATNPVQGMRARLGRTGQAAASAEAEEAAPLPDMEPQEARNVILASAVYVTGTRGLQVGSRYGIEIVGSELRILGPVDVDPTAVALVHPLRPIDATGVKERLIITAGDGRRHRLALVFMAVAGSTADRVAAALVAAAAALPPTPR